MYITIEESDAQTVRVYVSNGDASALTTMPTEKAVSAFAALVQGRKIPANISFADEKGRALFVSMNGEGFATIPMTDNAHHAFSKALARLACILTDTNTEGE